MPNAIRPDISSLVEQSSKLFIRSNFVSQETLSYGNFLAKKNASEILARQMEAIKQITDQDFLMEVALSSRATSLCEAAALLITSQEQLKTLNNVSKSGKVRAAAVSRINDQTLLVNLMLNDQNHFVVNAASKGIINQIHLAIYLKHAGSSPKEDFRKRAVLANISDQDLLKELAVSDIKIAKSNVTSEILSRINDEEFVKRAIYERLKSPGDVISPKAFSKITDQNFLKGIAQSNSVQFKLRSAAVFGINDDKFIAALLCDQVENSVLWNNSGPKLPHNLSNQEKDERVFVLDLIKKTNDLSLLNKLNSNLSVMLLAGSAINSRATQIRTNSGHLASLVRN